MLEDEHPDREDELEHIEGDFEDEYYESPSRTNIESEDSNKDFDEEVVCLNDAPMFVDYIMGRMAQKQTDICGFNKVLKPFEEKFTYRTNQSQPISDKFKILQQNLEGSYNPTVKPWSALGLLNSCVRLRENSSPTAEQLWPHFDAHHLPALGLDSVQQNSV